MFVALLTFFSASPPRKPMRVILLRYIRFSCSARLSRAPGSEWARLPRPEAAFLGGPARGSQNRNGAEGKAEASQAPGSARAPKQCRDGVEQETDRKQSSHGWSQPPKKKVRREIIGSRRPIDLLPTPGITRTLRWWQQLRHRSYAACCHV